MGPSSVPPPDLSAFPESARFGRFVRTEKLGAGGMGEVWKAWDVELARWVALKFMKGDESEAARFKREAQVAGRLAHPNIAAIYDVGFAHDRHYIAMQYVEGRTLRRDSGDRRERARQLRDAARAVAFANTQGIIHRDIKPDNIMVEGAGARVYVMDFGLARSVEAGLTASGLVVGTPAYMAPEQARGERVDARADVYSLGATLYEILVGAPPFEGSNVFDLLTKVIDEEPRPPRALDAAIEPDLETIVLKCLQKDPARRYADAAELADDLDRFLSGEPIRGRRSSIVYRLRLSLAKRKVAAGAIGLMLAALAAAAFMGSRWLTSRADLEVQRELNALWTRLMDEKEHLRDATQTSSAVFGRLRKAAEPIDDHIRRHPARPQGYFVRARARVILLEFDAAERDLRRCLELEPRFAPARALLGRVLLERGGLRLYNWELSVKTAAPLFDEAARELERAWAGDAARMAVEEWGLPRSRDDEVSAVLAEAMIHGYARNDPARAVAILREADARSPAAEYSNRLGNMLMKQGDSEGALRAQSDAITRQPHGAMAYLDRGYLKLRRLDYDGAVADCTRAIEIVPWLVVAYINRASALFRNGDPQGSLADCLRATELDPHQVLAWVNRSLSETSLGRPAEALKSAEEALRIDATHAGSWDARAMARAKLGDVTGALADGVRAVELDPDNPGILGNRAGARVALGNQKAATGDLDGAAELYRLAEADMTRVISLEPRSPMSWSERAVARRQLRDYPGAVTDCTRALELDPKMARAWLRRGEARLRLGQPEKAREDFTAVLALDPRQAEALVLRSESLRLLGRIDEALKDASAALAISPTAGAFMNRAQIRRETGDAAAAFADAQEAVKLGPERADAWASRSLANVALGRLEAALADAAKAVALNPRSAQAYHARSSARHASGDLSGAVRDLDEALKLDDAQFEPWYNRAKFRQMLANAERRSQADLDAMRDACIADYTKAIELRPGFGLAYTSRGMLKRVRGDRTGGMADLERAVALDPRSPSVWSNRGVARRQDGDREGAISDFEKALEIAPPDWSHRERLTRELEQLKKR